MTPRQTTGKRESSVIRPQSISARSRIRPGSWYLAPFSGSPYLASVDAHGGAVAQHRAICRGRSPWITRRMRRNRSRGMGDLHHLEGHVAPVDDKLRANLHELFSHAGHLTISRCRPAAPASAGSLQDFTRVREAEAGRRWWRTSSMTAVSTSLRSEPWE
jgi:hypothetical protein